MDIADEISELRHIVQAANQNNTTIKFKIRNILKNFNICIQLNDEYQYR